MIDIRPVLFVIGILLAILAAAMTIPAIVDASFDDRDWSVFAGASAVTGFFAASLVLATRPSGEIRVNLHQAFLLTALSWIFLSLFAALPFYFSSLEMDFIDSFYESVSGLTATGATVISGLDDLPAGILLWRAILQWLGGLGIIVMAIAILPILRVGGMQLFRMESSDRYEKVMPRATQFAATIVYIYLCFSVLCTLAYWAVGMSFFDAVCHMMTTISTGGFSTHYISLAYFDNSLIEMVATVFMLLGAMSFPVFIAVMQSRWNALWQNQQLRGFFLCIAVVTVGLTIWQWHVNDIDVLEAFRHALFNVVSVITTTGFASTDYSLWGGFPVAVFFLLTFVGGCTGSTTGGIKIFRFQVLYAITQAQIRRLIQPHGVFIPTYQGREITDPIALSVIAFLFMYGLFFAVLSMALGAFGLDFLTSISGAATAIGNVGPGLGDVIGPVGNFATVPDGAKLILSIGMLLGRLEFMTLIIVLLPRFWRH